MLHGWNKAGTRVEKCGGLTVIQTKTKQNKNSRSTTTRRIQRHHNINPMPKKYKDYRINESLFMV